MEVDKGKQPLLPEISQKHPHSQGSRGIPGPLQDARIWSKGWDEMQQQGDRTGVHTTKGTLRMTMKRTTSPSPGNGRREPSGWKVKQVKPT